MKKGLAVLLSGILVFSAGCTKQNKPETANQTKGDTQAANTGNTVVAKDGYGEGEMHDTMRTYFFDYTINSAYQTDSYEGIEPGEGKALLVVNMTVKNTGQSELEIYDTDFQAQWGDGDDDFTYPITNNGQEAVGAMAEETYTLQASEKKTSDLVFEVPQGKEEFAVAYREQFADDTNGDTFFTYFKAAKK